MGHEERRASPRIAGRVMVPVRFTSWNMFSFIYTINISRGGMSLEVDEEPKSGTQLIVQLQPPDGSTIDLEAVVRHTAKLPARDYAACPPTPSSQRTPPSMPIIRPCKLSPEARRWLRRCCLFSISRDIRSR